MSALNPSAADRDAETRAGRRLAASAGLIYVRDTGPGLTRRRCGTGFTYVDADGEFVTGGPHRERADALAIPPAWTDVWIAADRRAHLQATGRDAAGRKQYRYHTDWVAAANRLKFARLAEFGRLLPGMRRKLRRRLRDRRVGRVAACALAVGILDETAVRVGGREYTRDNDSFGLTTLRPDHLRFERGRAVFEFVGKGGAERRVFLRRRSLRRVLKRTTKLPGGPGTLLRYRASNGRVARLDAARVNAFLGTVTAGGFTAKEFRTWHGTVAAVESLDAVDRGSADPDGAVLAAIDAAAERLGNTRAVCREYYVHPAVAEVFRDGRWPDGVPRVRGLGRAERLTLAVLDRDENSPG